MPRKRKMSKKKTGRKIYPNKTAARNAAKKRPGNWSAYKVKGGYSLTRRKKK